MNARNWMGRCLIGVVILLALASPTGNAFARTGGPETSGYVYVDSDETDGPAYNYQSFTGTALSLGDNQMSAAIPLNFTFEFFGVSYTQVYASSNGFLTFLAGQPAQAAAQPVPTAATPNALVAGWWGDLKPNLGGTITYAVLGSAPQRTFIIQYQDIPYALLSLTAKTSFQIKLFEGNANNTGAEYSRKNQLVRRA